MASGAFGAMFGTGGSGAEPKFREMKPGDLTRVVRMIEAHDEDDAAEAFDSLKADLAGMFVLDRGGFSMEAGGTVIAVTGARRDRETDAVVWLSWTYVDAAYQRQGYGRFMLAKLLQALSAARMRKLFIATSDYMEDGEDIYAAAKAFYAALGARLELTLPDYYAPGESKYVYGLSIPGQQDDVAASEASAPMEPAIPVFTGFTAAPEAERGLALTWSEAGSEESAEEAAQAPPLDALIDEARAKGARLLVAAVPSDMKNAAGRMLSPHGFIAAGALRDYYATGLDQAYWQLVLDPA